MMLWCHWALKNIVTHKKHVWTVTNIMKLLTLHSFICTTIDFFCLYFDISYDFIWDSSLWKCQVCFYCLGRAIIGMVYYLSIRRSSLESSMLKWLQHQVIILIFPEVSRLLVFFIKKVNWVLTVGCKCQ